MSTALVFFLITIRPLVPGKMTPELVDILKNVSPEEKVFVIAHMDTEYPYHLLKGMHYQEKCAVFKDIAENSQIAVVEYLESLPQDKAEMGGQFWIFNGFHLKATRDVIEELAKRDDIWFICENGRVHITYEKGEEVSPDVVEWNIQKIMADSCWAAGYNGSGIIIGIIDTGVLTTHEALSGKWLSPYWLDAINGNASPYDDNGHGTHCMGTICGGDGPGPFTNDIGVAYGAQYIPTKALNSSGSGTYESVDTCMQYLADLKAGGVDIRVISNSWGATWGGDLHCWDAVLNWHNLGIFPVFANGNSGPEPGTVILPGCYPTTIGIGATDSDDNIADFSSRGPAPDVFPIYDPNYWYYPTWNLLKPDVSAPGVDVRSAFNDGGYYIASGTSMATPHVAGGTAIFLDKNPGLTIYDLYDFFCQFCDQPASGAPYPNMNYGWGRINLWNSLQVVPPLVGSIKETNSQKTDKTCIFDVYPNPVTSHLSACFQIPTGERLNLNLYDVSGRLVCSLINSKTFEMGSHNLKWNLENVKNGIYFLVLKTNHNKISKKIVVAH